MNDMFSRRAPQRPAAQPPLMAYITGLGGPAATIAAVLHPIARFLFQIFYIADRPRLRGAMYVTGLLCSATLIGLSLIRVGAGA